MSIGSSEGEESGFKNRFFCVLKLIMGPILPFFLLFCSFFVIFFFFFNMRIFFVTLQIAAWDKMDALVAQYSP